MTPDAPDLRVLVDRLLTVGQAARPLLTGYDPNGRVELSAATTANWVAKTANLLLDDLEVPAGAPVCVLAPAHWQTAVLLLGCWTAGVQVVLGEDPGAAVVFADPAHADAVGGQVVRMSLLPVGGAVGDVPDFAAEVRRQPDQFHPDEPLTADTPALRLAGQVLTTAELSAAADAAVDQWLLVGTDRVLSALGYDTLPGLLGGLLAPLSAGGSVVLHAAEGAAQVVGAERVTATAGVSVTGVRRLDG